jgi:hypothetical protein
MRDFSSALKALLYAVIVVAGISTWMLIAVAVYFSADIFAAMGRDYVFNNMCPSPLMHRWEDSLSTGATPGGGIRSGS